MKDENLPAVVLEEQQILQRVRYAVRDRALSRNPDMGDIARRLVEIRDEAAVASEHDLPALLDQLHLHQSLASRTFSEPLPDLRAPYFGHLILKEGEVIREVLIGHLTFIDSKANVTIVDWKTAPIARIYFNYREGDHYYEQLPGRVAEGEVLSRRIISFRQGELSGVRTGEHNYRCEPSGVWQKASAKDQSWRAGGQGSATRGFWSGGSESATDGVDISGLLDPEQYALLTRSDNEPLLILGGAGCGKTTVALHRLAYLAHSSKRYKPERMLVVVPETGLVRLSRRLLESLGMGKVRVSSYDDWIALQGRHLLRTLPQKLCEATPAKVVRLKRHPAMLELFDELAQWRWDDFLGQIARELHFVQDLDAHVNNLPKGNLKQRVASLRAKLRNVVRDSAPAGVQTARLEAVDKTFKSLEKQLVNISLDRGRLFTDQKLLARLPSITDGAISEDMIDELVTHSRKQLLDADAVSYGHIDVERRTTIDGQVLESDETDEFAGTIDVEDYSLMFALLEHYTGELVTPHGRFLRYMHLLIDEAQELAPVELQMLGASLADDASVTIAGDAAQQTDPSTSFSNWQNVLYQLGLPDVKASHLRTNYRSPRQVTEFAHAILGDGAPKECPKALREGPPVVLNYFDDPGHAATLLVETLEDLHRAQPRASTAVICHDASEAMFFYNMLQSLPDVRLVLDGEFSFSPGIDVTEVAMVKGLEFDYVLLPDVTMRNYQDRPDKRRLLHVAATRAMFQLWVSGIGLPSPIIDSYEASNTDKVPNQK